VDGEAVGAHLDHGVRQHDVQRGQPLFLFHRLARG
jgi:hypothetical protein